MTIIYVRDTRLEVNEDAAFIAQQVANLNPSTLMKFEGKDGKITYVRAGDVNVVQGELPKKVKRK